MNPYTTPNIVPIDGSIESKRDRWSYLLHFVSFNTSFIACLIGFYCVFAGITETLSSLRSEPASWAIQIGLGVLVWLVHATILCFSPRLRLRRPSFIGIVGGSSFVAFFFIRQIIQDYAPNSISSPVSWIPTSVLIAIFIGGSIAGVVLLTVLPLGRSRSG